MFGRTADTGDEMVEGLLGLGYSPDAWEAKVGATSIVSIVAVDEEQLIEVEKQDHAHVERLSPLEGFDTSNLSLGGQSC